MTATIHLTTKEDRRTWQALTRCAPSVDDDPELAFVCLDGERAYATDSYLVGILAADADLPVLETVDKETGEVGYAQPDKVLLPAVLLRDAIGLAKGKTHVRIRLEDDAAVVILGEDPLPGLGDLDPGPSRCLGGACPHDHDELEELDDYQEPDDG